MTCSVYWIRLPEHSDFLTQGYVGITSSGLEHRYAQHLSDARLGKSTSSARAIRKYGDKLVMTTLVIASEDYCLDLERKIRPCERIGWNIVTGGGKPPVFKGHSEAGKSKISSSAKSSEKFAKARKTTGEALKGKVRPPHVVEILRAKALALDPWSTSRSNRELWLRAEEFHQYAVTTGYGHINIEKYFGLGKDSLKTIYKKFKQGWIPSDDPKWRDWVQTHKGNIL